VKMCSSK